LVFRYSPSTMTIRIGTSERGGTFHSQGLALKAILERQPSLAPVEVLDATSASIENANRLHAGAIEFGFMASNWIGRARNGEPPFRAPIEIRMAAPMNAGPLFFITRAPSPIRSVGDLRGKRLVVGAAGSGMVQHAHTIFDVLGLRFEEFEPVYLDFAAGADALAAGAVDAQFQCPIPNQVMTRLSERTDVRVLAYAPGELDALIKTVPYYRRTVMRKGALRGLDTDSPQVAVVNVLATHARLPDAAVRDAVGAIIAGREELGRLNLLFLGFDEMLAPLREQGPAALEFGGVPLHPGALAAYRDAGWVV
jgi:TRAP transporter TAXI family solute receptor